MRVVEPSISAPTKFSVLGRCRSKSCLNPNVSRIINGGRSIHSMASALGLLQGGDFVTARAREMVQGPFECSTHRPIVQPTTREVEGLQIQHPRRPGDVFPEV